MVAISVCVSMQLLMHMHNMIGNIPLVFHFQCIIIILYIIMINSETEERRRKRQEKGERGRGEWKEGGARGKRTGRDWCSPYL